MTMGGVPGGALGPGGITIDESAIAPAGRGMVMGDVGFTGGIHTAIVPINVAGSTVAGLPGTCRTKGRPWSIPVRSIRTGGLPAAGAAAICMKEILPLATKGTTIGGEPGT